MTAQQESGSRIVALTGATGFIGSILLRRLVEANWQVRALYRPRGRRVLPQLAHVEWLAGDLHDGVVLAQLVAGVDAVIHCAGAVRGASRADFDRVNEDGVRRVVEATTRESPSARFLLLSSLAAREPGLSDYAGSKRRGEDALRASAGNMRWTVLRPPAVYGPGDRELRPVFQGMERGFALVPGHASARLSLLYVEDLASAVVRWLSANAGFGEVFELDDGNVGGYDWDDMLRIAAEVLRNGAAVRKLPAPVWVLRFIASINLGAARVLRYAPMLTPGKVREITHQDWVAHSEPFARATGWSPAFSFRQGLARTFGRDPFGQGH